MPPATSDITVNVLNATDLVLIPVGPSALDLWSSKQILALLEKSGTKGLHKKAKSAHQPENTGNANRA